MRTTQPAAGGGASTPADFSLWLPDAPPEIPGALDDEFTTVGAGVPSGWTEFDPDTLQTVAVGSRGLELSRVIADAPPTYSFSGIYKAIPAGDFSVIVQVSCSIEAGLSCDTPAGLALFENAVDTSKKIAALSFTSDDVAIVLSVEVEYFTNYQTFSASKVVKGKQLQPGPYFRVRRTGTDYFFDVSGNGIAWSGLLVQTEVQLGFTPLHFGPFINGAGNGTAGNTLKGIFPFFRYKASDVGLNGVLEGARVNGFYA